jgi:hypothetical protein
MTNCRVLRALSQTNFPLKNDGILAFRQNSDHHSLVQPHVGEPTPHGGKPTSIKFPSDLRDSENELLKLGVWHISC